MPILSGQVQVVQAAQCLACFWYGPHSYVNCTNLFPPLSIHQCWLAPGTPKPAPHIVLFPSLVWLFGLNKPTPIYMFACFYCVNLDIELIWPTPCLLFVHQILQLLLRPTSPPELLVTGLVRQITRRGPACEVWQMEALGAHALAEQLNTRGVQVSTLLVRLSVIIQLPTSC